MNKERILAEVCAETGVTVAQMESKYKDRDIVTARHITWLFLSRFTSMNTMQMGAMFNRRHCTVVLARKRMMGYIDTEASTVELVWRIVERLNIEIQ